MELLRLNLATPGVEVRARVVARRVSAAGGLSDIGAARMAALASDLARTGRAQGLPYLSIAIEGRWVRWLLPGPVPVPASASGSGWTVAKANEVLLLSRQLRASISPRAVSRLQQDLLAADPMAMEAELRRQNQELVDTLTQLRAAERQLARSERRLSLALEATELGTWERGSEGWWLSERCRETVRADQATDPLPERLEPSLAAELEAGLARLTHAPGQLAAEGRTRGGLTVDIRALSDGDLIVGTLHDISEQREREHRLERQAEVRQLLMGIAGHDLRTPLAVLRQGLALTKPGRLPKRAGEIHSRMVRACDNAAELIRTMLDITEADLGSGIKLVPGPADVHEVAGEAVQAAALVHPSVDFRHTREGEGAGDFDVGRMNQVFSNLIDNAARHTSDGVAVHTAGSDGELTFRVSNPGEEIPEAERHSVFEPLVRATVRRGRGLGLGLYIVQHIVKRHHGSVVLEYPQPGLTSFLVRIPRQPPQRSDEAQR